MQHADEDPASKGAYIYIYIYIYIYSVKGLSCHDRVVQAVECPGTYAAQKSAGIGQRPAFGCADACPSCPPR